MTPPLPGAARPDRPAFHDEPAIDRLVAILAQLLAEHSALADRLALLERLGAEAGWLAPGAVDAYRPDEGARAEAEARREALVTRVFAILEAELEQAEPPGGASRPAYWRAVGETEGGS